MTSRSYLRIPIVAEMLIFMTVGSFSSTSYAALDPFIKAQFLMSHAEIGLITGVMFLGFLTIQFIAGHLIDEFGTYSASKIAFGLVALGSLFLLVANSSVLIYAGYYAFGLGFGIIPPATNKGTMDAYKPHHASKMGIKQAGFSGGAAVSAFSLPLIALYFSLRYSFLVILLLSLMLFFLIRRERRETRIGWSSRRHLQNMAETIQDKKLQVLSAASVIFSWGQQTMLAYFALFEEFRGFHIIIAEIFLGILLLGSVLGIALWPSLSNKIFRGKRFQTMYVIMTLSGIFYLLFVFTSMSLLLNGIVAFFIGFTTVGWNSTYMTSVSEIAPSKSIGLFSSVSLMFMTLGTIVGTPLSGMIVDSISYGTMWSIMGAAQLILAAIFYSLSIRIRYDEYDISARKP